MSTDSATRDTLPEHTMGFGEFAALLVLGGIVGSVLTAVIERLPTRRSLVAGRSACPRCGTTLAPRDLIPVVSFLVLRGRCRACRSAIPRWHLAVELGAIGLFVLTAVLRGDESLLTFGSLLAILTLLLALTVIDLQHFLLPDSLVAGVAAVGLLRSLALGIPGFPQSLLAGAVGLVALGALAIIPWLQVRRSLGGGGRSGFLPATRLRSESSGGSPAHFPSAVGEPAMGLGDVKLAGAMGIVLGLPHLVFALFLAFVLGGLLGATLVATRRASLKTRLPFGPFLAGTTAATLIVPQLADAFFSFLGVY